MEDAITELAPAAEAIGERNKIGESRLKPVRLEYVYVLPPQRADWRTKAACCSAAVQLATKQV